MSIKYHEAQDIKEKVRKIVQVLDMDHVNLERVFFIRSHESSSRNIIARCHALPKILQQVLEIEPAYVIEILSEKFDRMSEEDQMKTLIHELLHIPKSFGGGFRHHDFVNRRIIDKLYKEFLKNEKKFSFEIPKSFDESEKSEELSEDDKKSTIWDF